MRLLLPALAVLCVSSHAAHADTYTINYQPFSSFGSNQPAITGSFNYDGSTFSSFIVSSQGFNFDFTRMANQGFGPAGSPTAGCQTGSTFHFLSATGSCTPYLSVQQTDTYVGTTLQVTGVSVDFDIPDPSGNPSPNGVYASHTVAEADVIDPLNNVQKSFGSFHITDVASGPPQTTVTPEPSTLALLGTGLCGAVGVLRKRFK